MTLIGTLLALIFLGIGISLFIALLRWLVLVGVLVLWCIGAISIAVGAIAFFTLYQFFGTAYGPIALALSIAIGLVTGVLLLKGIAAEVSGTPNKR